MAIVSIAELKTQLPAGTRLLGLDLGEKTIGLAVSDRDLKVASPLETLRRAKFKRDAASLAEICAERGIGGLVLGLPVNMDGSEGPRCQSVRQFARNLAEVAGLALPVAFWDERLSTVEAKHRLADAGRRGPKAKARRDAAAAAIILQGYLDSQAQDSPSAPFES